MNPGKTDKSTISSGNESYCRVGSVLKSQGVDGSFVLFLESDFPKWLASRKVLYAATAQGFEPWHVTQSRPHKNTLVFKVDELENRDQVESVRGLELFVPLDEARRANVDPDYFFNSDLVGSAVVDSESGEQYGVVVEVQASPGQDLLKIKRPTGAPFLFPFSSALITSIDLANGHITVKMPEGLMDLS